MHTEHRIKGVRLDWNRTAFNCMLEDEKADSAYFMCRIRYDSDSSTNDELTWCDKTLLCWRKDAVGEWPFFGYLKYMVFRIGDSLINDNHQDVREAPRSLLPDFARCNLVEYLINRNPAKIVQHSVVMDIFNKKQWIIQYLNK